MYMYTRVMEMVTHKIVHAPGMGFIKVCLDCYLTSVD